MQLADHYKQRIERMRGEILAVLEENGINPNYGRYDDDDLSRA